jgi:MarR family multiple gene transcriptional regulator MgrA
MKNDVGYLIKQIDECLYRKANQNLKPIDLTLSQVKVLILLREREKTRQLTSHKDIEESLHVSHPTVLGLLRRLEAKGFIRTETGTADRRIRNVFLTQRDASFWDSLRTNQVAMEKLILANFSKEEKDTLRLLLTKLLHNIQ